YHMVDISISDDVLMRKFCAGDGKAFQALYARHEKPLYRYLRRVLGSTLLAQVDEVFQDTWMRMVDARDSWQPRDGVAFKTWLYTLAHHRAVDVNDTPWQLWPASTAEQPEQQAFWRKAGQQLLHCLDGLPALQRAAFLLHHEDGLSLDEMTQVLNAEFETVKSRLRYALSKLRLCMGAHLQPIFESDNTA
ncbi:MAG: sigma-70 family RNA polymerase sigma factor, partial [Methylotenera sp.]